MSASVVDQLHTDTRISLRPCHVVPPSQQVPSACTASITRLVRAPVLSGSSPNPASTWFSTTSLTISAPPSASPAAKRRACLQDRPIISDTPERPRWRNAAQVAKPRARREDSTVKSAGLSSAPPEPVRYGAV